MRLTKEKALEMCVELWSWLAENPTKEKSDWPGWEGKKKEGYWNGCPCCEWMTRNYPDWKWAGPREWEERCIDSCPIKWPGGFCESNSDTPWERWIELEDPRNAQEIRDRKKAALDLVKLAKRSLKELK
jgi:hypothetical protein